MHVHLDVYFNAILIGPVHVVPGQLTDPGANFASVHGLRPVTVHISFSLPRQEAGFPVVQHRATRLAKVTFLYVNGTQKLSQGKSSPAHAYF